MAWDIIAKRKVQKQVEKLPDKIRVVPKTGHYTYNYLKTLEIIFNMDEWQIW